MRIVCHFKNGSKNERLGAGVQWHEIMETITAYFGNENFIGYDIYKNDCTTLIMSAHR